MIDRMVEKTTSIIVWNPVGHPKSLAKLDVGGWVRMVLLWILLLLCTVCTQGRKQALGRWYPVVSLHGW